ncbi:polysaccharide deacetylase family protein [bacterium]|nr:polysaccharide deacetylase family protein [bacterium]
MKFKKNIIFTALFVFLSSLIVNCGFIDNFCNTELKGPGAIVLTFDDRHISDWYKADSIFSKYNWKATFCVTDYGKVNEEQKQNLLELQSNGNEIAHHGFKHFNALEYLTTHTMEEYIQNEITPSLDLMQNDGLNVTSFVYPGGVRSVELDLALFDYFPILRGTTYGNKPLNQQDCFLKRGGEELLVYGLGIDNHYEHFDIDYYYRLIEYVANNGIAVIFYGHRIADDDSSSYVTSYQTLEKICTYAQEKGVEFLTLKELINFNLN